jgi:transposase
VPMQQPVEVDVDESQEVVERVAAIDVAKATGMVCTRVPHHTVAGKRVTKVWEVKATTKALAELADHLVAAGIQRTILESTSDYWRAFYYVLEGAGLEVWLVNAAQAKNVPGRPKTDKIDAVWLAKLAERSMVSASFVPAEPMRQVRDLARARFDLVGDRSRVKQRVEKLLEDALVKISSVLSDIHGVSGRAMIEALIAGERRPAVLAELAKGRARARLSVLAEAADGRFTDHHGRLARMLLDQIDDLAARIDTITGLLDQAIAAVASVPTPTVDAATGDLAEVTLSYPTAVERICALPGGGPDTGRAVIGEIGLDMAIFGTAARLCSWAKVSPRTVESGRKKGKAKTGSIRLAPTGRW